MTGQSREAWRSNKELLGEEVSESAMVTVSGDLREDGRPMLYGVKHPYGKGARAQFGPRWQDPAGSPSD